MTSELPLDEPLEHPQRSIGFLARHHVSSCINHVQSQVVFVLCYPPLQTATRVQQH